MANKELKNNQLVERVYLLAQAVGKKNPTISGILGHSVIELLKYKRDLYKASDSDLRNIKWVKEATLPYIRRIIKGDSIDNIANDIPEYHNKFFDKSQSSQHNVPKERSNYDDERVNNCELGYARDFYR